MNKYRVLIEKYKKWDYINNHGYYVWTNKYGDIFRVEDENGNIKQFFNAVFDAELMQDLAAYGIDAEAELTALLAENIAREIDREIIQQLLDMNG